MLAKEPISIAAMLGDDSVTVLTDAARDLVGHDDLIDLLSSAQSGNGDRQTEIELFEGKTDAVFDPSSAAAAASSSMAMQATGRPMAARTMRLSSMCATMPVSVWRTLP